LVSVFKGAGSAVTPIAQIFLNASSNFAEPEMEYSKQSL